VATKFGWDLDEQGGRRGLNSRPEHIRKVIDQSLQRLGTDYVDLPLPAPGGSAVPIEDVAGAVGELVEAGKVRYFGLSEAAAATIRRAHATFPVSVLQVGVLAVGAGPGRRRTAHRARAGASAWFPTRRWAGAF